MLDDGVTLIARDHADVEKPAVLGIAHGLESARALVAIILRRLDDRDPRILESGNQVAQPVGIDDVIAVDDGDDLRIGGGTRQGEVQSAGLEAL